MRKFYSIILFLIICVTPSYAYKTTFTSSIYASSNEGSTAVVNEQIDYSSITKKVFFIRHENTDTVIDIMTAITKAEIIFSEALQQENIDLIDIRADIMFGESSSFESEEVCKVEVIYSDTLVDNPNYHDFYDRYSLSPDIDILVPMAMSNQTRGGDYGECMHIMLNPNLKYNYGNSAIDSSEYDLITVLLRALAMGCGIQSTVSKTVHFGIDDGMHHYINAFDTQIYNDAGYTYADVVAGNVTSVNFLAGHDILVSGLENIVDPLIIHLYNDWQVGVSGTNISHKTLNTIDGITTYSEDEWNEGFMDLLDADLEKGVAIRTVTPYTMAILRKLGWMKTVAVGYNPYTNLYNCRLQCSSTILYPDTPYLLSLGNGNVSLSSLECELFARNGTYTIGEAYPFIPAFEYSDIPDNIQWQRNPVTKNIIGRLKGIATQGNASMEKTLGIEIPYRPNKPIIQKSEVTEDGLIELTLKVLADGSNSYTLTYTGVTNGDVHTFTVYANRLDTILTNIPATQLYNMSIYGTNNHGNSNSYNFTFGFSAQPTLTLTTSVQGNILTYDLSSNGTIDISDVVISSVQITDANGNIWLTPNSAGSGDPISISSLLRGYYILTVVADGHSYSRMFIKR